jgi:hypothetical protein
VLVLLTQPGCGRIRASGIAPSNLPRADRAAIVPDPQAAQAESICGPPHYCARTYLNPQPYPDPIPCPSASGCGAGGALTGANYTFTPADFNSPVTRITDSRSGDHRHDAFFVNCGGSAETNFMNRNDDRFYLCDAGAEVLVWHWDSSALHAKYSYGLKAALASPFWSFTQPYVLYDLEINGRGNVAVYSYDFTNPMRPVRAQVVDLAGCVPALAGITNGYVDDVTVSGDDQTFAALLSSTPGQGSSGAVYVVVWNRSEGCRVWNTGTGVVTGDYGGAPAGKVSVSDTFVLHNVRLSKGGAWVRAGPQSCTGKCNPNANYLWDIGALTVTIAEDAASCGHVANGYNLLVNQCGYGGHAQNFLIRSVTNALNSISLPSAFPRSESSWDTHGSWNNDVTGDVSPVLVSQDPNQFTPVNAWDNEILWVATDGSVAVYRFAHTYATEKGGAGYFSPQHAIGNVSADGRWYAWSTDWDGMLGNTNNSSAACTLGKDCRADVFLIPLR